MYLGRVLNSPRVIRYTDFIDNRLEYVLSLHYLHHNSMSHGSGLLNDVNLTCLDLSVSSSSWGLGRAAVCDCGTPWTFLLPFFLRFFPLN